jgi:phage tail-like protein
MDANGTHFHLLLGETDWGSSTDGQGLLPAELWSSPPRAGHPAKLRWDRQRYELTLQPRLFQFTSGPKDNPPAFSDRRGTGRDRFGNWYWIDETGGEILVNSSGTQTTSHFWSLCDGWWCEQPPGFGDFGPLAASPAPARLRLRGLTVTEDHYLVVGVLEPAGLLIFDLHAGGPPQQMLWPATVGFMPFDMSPRAGGGVWILDRDFREPAWPARYWALDRHFHVLIQDQQAETLADRQRDDFQPADCRTTRRTARRVFPRGILLEAASPLAALDAIAIEGLPDGSVLILDRNEDHDFSLIYRFDGGQQLGDPVSTEVMKDLVEAGSAFTLVAHDFAFVPEHEGTDGKVLDRVYVVARDGNQAFAFNLSEQHSQIKLDPVDEYLPMRLFGGKGLVAAGTQAYYDFSDGWIPLVEQRRPRYVVEATFITPRFDGMDPDCVWHRLALDACIPPETTVRVSSRAANEARDLASAQWQPEPDLYLRGDGSEIPFAPNSRASLASSSQPSKGSQPPSPRGSKENRGTWELLFQRARGRFLQLKLTLSGNGRLTPRLRALRAYYPRFSYLEHYLPAVYREESESASFLDRFLANLEGFYTAMEDKLAAVQMLFDVRSAPAETLEWLASWFGLVLDPAWDERRRRLLIKHAMDFFQYRGTISGLEMVLRLAFDDCVDETLFDARSTKDLRRSSIRLIEKYRTRRTPGVAIGDPTELGVLRQVSQTARWQPANGRADLQDRYKQFLEQRYPQARPLPLILDFPISNPAWQKAPARVPEPGFVPITMPEDLPLWRDFLARRYATVSALNQAHGQPFNRFDEVPLPNHLPPGSALLQDWNDFIGEKALVWEQFSQALLGFVPGAVADERGLWRDFLAGRYANIGALNLAYGATYRSFEEVPLPADLPAAAARLNDWLAFTKRPMAAPSANKRKLWQDFLARRYRRIGALNQAYQTNWAGFDSVSLADELPRDGTPSQDWYQFESVVLAMHSTAHRFTVLLPLPPNSAADLTLYQHRHELARRIINWEKPAHTIFDVKFYWAMFRLGGARLGADTLLDVGSRAPQLMSPMVLGQNYLVESFLAPAPPQDAADRRILGRDGLRERAKTSDHLSEVLEFEC